MPSGNVQDIIKRYNFSGLTTTAWQDPQASVLPYRGGPKYTLSPKALAGSYQPTYRYPIKPPKPPTPPEATDDEESDGNDDAADEAEDPVATSSTDDVVVVDDPEASPPNEDLQSPSQPDEPTDATEQPPPMTVIGSSAPLPPSAEGETPNVELGAPPEDPATQNDEQATKESPPDDEPVAINVDAPSIVLDEAQTDVTFQESGSNDLAASEDPIPSQDQASTLSMDIPSDDPFAPSDEADFATFTLEDIQQPHSEAVDGDEAPPPAPDPPISPPDAACSPTDDAVDVSVAPPSLKIDKKVSFATEMSEPKATSRKKKGTKDVKRKQKKVSSAGKLEPSPDDIVTIVDEGAASSSAPPGPQPLPLPDSAVPEAVDKVVEPETATEVPEPSEPSAEAAAETSKASDESTAVDTGVHTTSDVTNDVTTPDDDQPPPETLELDNPETSSKIDDGKTNDSDVKAGIALSETSSPDVAEAAPLGDIPNAVPQSDVVEASTDLVTSEHEASAIDDVAAEQSVVVVEEAPLITEETVSAPGVVLIDDATAPAVPDVDGSALDDEVMIVVPPSMEVPSKPSKKKSAKSTEKDKNDKKKKTKSHAKAEVTEESIGEHVDDVSVPPPPPPQEQPNEHLENPVEVDASDKSAAVEVTDGADSTEQEVIAASDNGDEAVETAEQLEEAAETTVDGAVGDTPDPIIVLEPLSDTPDSEAQTSDVPPLETDAATEHEGPDVAESNPPVHDAVAVAETQNDEPAPLSGNEDSAPNVPELDSVATEDPQVEPVEAAVGGSESPADVFVVAENEDDAAAAQAAEPDQATEIVVVEASANDAVSQSGEPDPQIAVDAVVVEDDVAADDTVIAEEDKVAEQEGAPAVPAADSAAAPEIEATSEKPDDTSAQTDEPAIDNAKSGPETSNAAAEPAPLPSSEDQAAPSQTPDVAVDAIEASAEPEQAPPAPPSPSLSKSSAKRHQEGWTRQSKKSHDGMRALEPVEAKRSSRSSRTGSSPRDERHRSRRHSMTPEEEAERNRRRKERRERKAAEEAEKERTKAEKEQKRKLQKKIEEAAIRAAADEARKVVREKEDEKQRRRRRDSVVREADRTPSRKGDFEQVLDIGSPKTHRPVIPKSLTDTKGESRTRAGLLVRTSTDGYRLSGESTRRQRTESRPSDSPLLQQETSDPAKIERSRRSHRSSENRHEQRSEKLPAAPLSTKDSKAESNSSRHSSRRHAETTPEEERRDRPHRSRRESGRRERRPSLVMVQEKEKKKTSFFGSLIKAFK